MPREEETIPTDPEKKERFFIWLREILTDATETAYAGKLSSWEQSFASDVKERLDKYGQKLFLSEKQLAVLKKIEKGMYN